MNDKDENIKVKESQEKKKALLDLVEALTDSEIEESHFLGLPKSLSPVIRLFEKLAARDRAVNTMVSIIESNKPDEVGDSEEVVLALLEGVMKAHQMELYETLSKTLMNCEFVDKLQVQLSKDKAYGFVALLGILHAFMRHKGELGEIEISALKKSAH